MDTQAFVSTISKCIIYGISDGNIVKSTLYNFNRLIFINTSLIICSLINGSLIIWSFLNWSLIVWSLIIRSLIFIIRSPLIRCLSTLVDRTIRLSFISTYPIFFIKFILLFRRYFSYPLHIDLIFSF